MDEMKARTILTAVLMTAAAAGAQDFDRAIERGGPGGRHGRPDFGKMQERLIRRLKRAEVDEKVIDAVRDACTEHEKNMLDKKAELEKAHLEMRHLARDKDVSKSALLSQVDAISRIRTDMAKERIEHRFALRDLIGEDLIDDLREQARERMKNAQGKRRGPRAMDDEG
jgi:hypothetical protein